MFLESQDYEVILATDGEDALNFLKQGEYDLLITDHLMPNLSGVDLVRLTRSHGNRVPSVLISGDMPTHEPGLEELFLTGGLLEKPFSMTRFLSVVDGVLRSKQRAA